MRGYCLSTSDINKLGGLRDIEEGRVISQEDAEQRMSRCLGFDSKTVITGDITQVDLQGRASGLIEAKSILKDIEGIKFVYFDGKDVVRHELVQEIIRAYEKQE